MVAGLGVPPPMVIGNFYLVEPRLISCAPDAVMYGVPGFNMFCVIPSLDAMILPIMVLMAPLSTTILFGFSFMIVNTPRLLRRSAIPYLVS